MRESLFGRGLLKCAKHTYPWEVCRELENSEWIEPNPRKTGMGLCYSSFLSLCSLHTAGILHLSSEHLLHPSLSWRGSGKKPRPAYTAGCPKARCELLPCRAKLQERGKDREARLLKLHWLRLTKSWPPQCQHLADYAHTVLQNQESTGAGRLIQEASRNGHRAGLGWEAQRESSAPSEPSGSERTE